MQTDPINVPETSLFVLTEPATMQEAHSRTDIYGRFTGTVKADTEMFYSYPLGSDEMDNYLTSLLVAGMDPYNIDCKILGTHPDESALLVQVTVNVVGYLEEDPEYAAELGITL